MQTPPSLTTGGIVLCGGYSRRMGRPKHLLPFGQRTMLEHVVSRLSEAVSPVVVVSAAGQELPRLPADVLITHDEIPDAGPLAGILAGLEALGDSTAAAFATSCDSPLLQTNFVLAMINSLGSHLLAIPRQGKYLHPLAAIYRTGLAETIRSLLAEGQRRPGCLLDHVSSIEIDVASLAHADPHMDSLRNINTPAAYKAMLDECGFLEQSL